MVPVIACFIGWSNTGKTTFIESCITVLHGRSVQCGAIKCVRHSGTFNLPGKDTTRFFDAGADAAIISDHEAHVVCQPRPDWDAGYVLSLFPQARVIFVEGRLLEGAVRVLVGGPAETADQLKQPPEEFDVLITDKVSLSTIAKTLRVHVFGPGEAGAFIDVILQNTQQEE